MEEVEWKHQPFIRANYSSTLIAQLETELKALNKESSDQTEIEWGLRQMEEAICKKDDDSD